MIAERPELDERLEHEIDPSVQEELQQHPGKWVALTRSQILAVGDTPSEALDAAQAKGINAPILHRVPEDSNTTYFF